MALRDWLVLGAGVLLVGGCFGAYKAYEYSATGGVGFVEADELQIDESVDVRTKKDRFFDFMKPIVKAENARLADLRDRLIEVRGAGEDPDWLADVAETYRVDWPDEGWETLLKRVDTVPMALVLAQSANESSWGRSRFAQQANNMFGQWCFSEGCGVVPNRRSAGKSHEVAAYDSVNASVRSYLLNVNRGAAYQSLRSLRWQARLQDVAPSAEKLAGGLTRYSERGQAYVEEIRAMIRVNRPLMELDG